MRDPADPSSPEHDPAVEPVRPAKRFGFPRERRLLKHALFDRVYKQGQRQFSTSMTVFYLRRNDEAGVRVGLTVPRALGGAVQRNRIKRRMRDAVRHNLEKLSAPVDVVINPKKGAISVDMPKLRSEVERAFEKIEQGLRRSAS